MVVVDVGGAEDASAAIDWFAKASLPKLTYIVADEWTQNLA